MAEEWRPVVGYEGCYEVSSIGRLRSLDRSVRGSYGSTILKRGRILKQKIDDRGRPTIGLCVNSVKKCFIVSHLVYAAFVGEVPPGKQIDHRDQNPQNNLHGNLRQATHGQNMNNRPKYSNNTSGYKGVSWSKKKRKWRATIMAGRKPIFLGLFDDKHAAGEAYRKAAEKYHGEFSGVS